MLLLIDTNIARARVGWLELRKGLRQQMVVIWALILREVRTRFGKHRVGYLWALVEPCMFMAVWLGVHYFMRLGTMIHDMSPILFMSCGLIPFLTFRRVATYVEAAISSNISLLQFPLVKSVDTLLARFILESATQIVVAVIIFSNLMFFGFAKAPRDCLMLFISSGALLLLGFAFGSFNCMVVAHFPLYSRFTRMIFRILFWFSGVLFLIDKFPAPVQNILRWNPVLHGIELFRSSWSYTYQTPVGSIWYMLLWIGGLLLVALILERSARREILQQ